VYVVVDYTSPLRFSSEATDAFTTFKAVAENESGNKLCEVKTDNTCEMAPTSFGQRTRYTILVNPILPLCPFLPYTRSRRLLDRWRLAREN
jgi:hypothetical protein